MMYPRTLLTALLLLVILPSAWVRGQRISGTVSAATTGEKLPFVSVFLNNTSIASETNLEGYYVLKNIPVGTYSLVVRQVGFKPFTQRIVIDNNTDLKLDVRLLTDEKLLEEIKVSQKKDKVWEQQFEQFEKQFLGDKLGKNQCRIVNPWVLEFSEEKNVLTAKANDILEINNQWLGYQIRYSLNEFRYDGAQVFFSGLAEFTSLYTNDASQKVDWEQHRAEAYRGSDVHFFKSLQGKTSAQEGFEFFVDKPGEDPTKRTPFFHQNQVKKLSKIQLDSTVKGVKNFYSLALPARIEVHYNGKEGVFSIYKDKACQVAWIETNGQPLLFNTQGIILNPQACSVSGYFAENRVSTLLPLDYTPPTNAIYNPPKSHISPSEAAYFTTDKPYYFTNDVVQVSGHMRYSSEEGADTLSQLVYVELVQPATKKVLVQQRLSLENRHFTTQILLQDSLILPDTYLLRAYTKWAQHQSDSTYSYRWIPVLKNEEMAVYLPSVPTDSMLIKVEELHDSLVVSLPSEGFSWGTMTVLSGRIEARYPLTSTNGPVVWQNGLIERGMGVSGKIPNYRPNKHESVLMVLPSANLSFFASINSNGYFQFTNLPLEGKQPVLLQVTNAKGKPALDAEFNVDSLISPKWMPTLATNQWKILPMYYGGLVKGAALQLNEVQVKAKIPPKPITSIYKEADYVLQGKDLYENAVGLNILSAIQGRVPGLRIVEFPEDNGLTKLVITMRMGASVGGFVRTKLPQPLVLVDGIGFDNINLISQIPAAQVERVEVVNRAESLLGLRGYVGVISIITKHAGAGVEEGNTNGLKGFQKFMVDGVSPKLIPKLGQLVEYWNPSVFPSSSAITILKVPKPPKTGPYSIYFEGLTYRGKPVVSKMHYTVH